MTEPLNPSPVEGVPDLWARICATPRRLLALDYDGTLAPYRVKRMEARPLPGIIEVLTLMQQRTNTRLAVISGRPLPELKTLLHPLNVELAASYGFEGLDGEGQTWQRPLNALQMESLEHAHRLATEAGHHLRIERKLASIAFHTRGISDGPDLNEHARHLWQPLAASCGLELANFHGGVELKATGADKGTALLDFLRSEPEETLTVYVGDDAADECAFRALPPGGIGIKVGPSEYPSAAQGRLADPHAVLSFLCWWYLATAKTDWPEVQPWKTPMDA